MSGSRNQAKVPTEKSPKSICRQASLFAASQCLGFKATLTTLAGRKFEGKLYTITSNGIILRDVWEQTKKSSNEKGLEKFVIFQRNEIVSCEVLDVSEPPKIVNKAKKSEFQTDTEISNRDPSGMKALQAWVADDEDPLENEGGLDERANTKEWDQFATNKEKFGIATTYDENFYTTRLEESDFTAEAVRNADKIAAEIMNQRTGNIHLDEERGLKVQMDQDEETRFSEVVSFNRKTRLDDRGGKKKRPAKGKKVKDENEGFASWRRNRVEPQADQKPEAKKTAVEETGELNKEEYPKLSEDTPELPTTTSQTKTTTSDEKESATPASEEKSDQVQESVVVEDPQNATETTEVEEEVKHEEVVQVVETPVVEVESVDFAFDKTKFEEANKKIVVNTESDKLNHQFSLKKIAPQDTETTIQLLAESYKPALSKDKKNANWPTAEKKDNNKGKKSHHNHGNGFTPNNQGNPYMPQMMMQPGYGMQMQPYGYGYPPQNFYAAQQQDFYYQQQMYSYQMQQQQFGGYPGGNPGRGDPNNYRGQN